LFAAFSHQLRSQVYEAAVKTVQYAMQFDTPRIVLAEESVTAPPLWGRRTNDGLGAWLCSALRCAVAETARDADVPAMRVEPAGARRACHRCGRDGRGRIGTFVCDHDECPVSRIDHGQSVAVSLARRIR
jgi:hypothetical protein